MTVRPDPSFHASPKLAMEAPPENFAYTLLLSPDFSKPDALAVVDVKPGSPTFSQIVHTVTMPYTGDEFHARERGSVWSIHRYGLAGEVAKNF